ncbi:TPA: hypothetical protein DCY43_02725 [candidate division WWE3 bacterium]|uniref:Hydrolase TatD n=3 Tax=Katanobacteria TaxID=422282 RepID=A0A1F4V5G9_UNCKA|nr:MAG: TatD family hydrolase [candidate division WWE3 bacterium GW2011_GWB1_44_4]OGC52432.1 MAG: hypothetical protein A2709_01605 [candidate division WWE3 bacterium RIFCSPHIGHO2_01_FULL_43_9]HAZ29639.1 hypothetical protein [candidate division WWE3 bacterium]
MDINLIDSHAHLPHLTNKPTLETLLTGAKDWGVEKIINIGTDLKEHPKVLEVCTNYQNVYCGLGIYPNAERDKTLADIVTKLEATLQTNPKVVAVGECGIDNTGWSNQRPLSEQEELFEAQIVLAIKYKLPLIVHNRNGTESVINLLRAAGKNAPFNAVIHCFDADWATAKRFLDLGLYISFSGFITRTTKKYLTGVAQKVPQDMYLVETDSPYILPQSAQIEVSPNKNNEPKYVRIVAQSVAKARGTTLEEVAYQSYTNSCKFFALH